MQICLFITTIATSGVVLESRERKISPPGSVEGQKQTGEPKCEVGKALRPPTSGLPGGVPRKLAEVF